MDSKQFAGLFAVCLFRASFPLTNALSQKKIYQDMPNNAISPIPGFL